MIAREKYTQLIKDEAARLGFSACGVSRADFLDKEAPQLEKWLKENKNGEMKYMENHFDMRLDPRLLVDGAKSVVSLLYNYYNPEPILGSDQYKISQYAYGQDYHEVIKEKLKLLLYFIEEQIGEVAGRAFVDSAPILEKAWAQKSGLGWMGKNGNIIHKKAGSFFFLSELILDLDLDYDTAVTDHCGSCTACIDACPTEAIYEPQKVDGSKCISYFTIELKEKFPNEMPVSWNNWIFGCDICMDVCPWNRFAKKHEEPKFEPNPLFLQMNNADWRDLTEEVFTELSKKSAIKRTKYNGLKRNIDFITKVNS